MSCGHMVVFLQLRGCQLTGANGCTVAAAPPPFRLSDPALNQSTGVTVGQDATDFWFS